MKRQLYRSVGHYEWENSYTFRCTSYHNIIIYAVSTLIKLGVGGLVRAYSGSVAKCLDRAGIIELFPTREYIIKAGVEWSSAVHGLLDQFKAEKLEESYDSDGLILKIRCRQADFGKLSTGLRDASRGQVTVFRS